MTNKKQYWKKHPVQRKSLKAVTICLLVIAAIFVYLFDGTRRLREAFKEDCAKFRKWVFEMWEDESKPSGESFYGIPKPSK